MALLLRHFCSDLPQGLLSKRSGQFVFDGTHRDCRRGGAGLLPVCCCPRQSLCVPEQDSLCQTLAQLRDRFRDDGHDASGQLAGRVVQRRNGWQTEGFIKPPKRGKAMTNVTDFINSGAECWNAVQKVGGICPAAATTLPEVRSYRLASKRR